MSDIATTFGGWIIVLVYSHAVQMPLRRRSYVYILFVCVRIFVYLYVRVYVCMFVSVFFSLPRFGEIKLIHCKLHITTVSENIRPIARLAHQKESKRQWE